MNVKRAITATITMGDQPTEADLEQLKERRLRGRGQLAQSGEPEQPMSSDRGG